MAQREPKSVTHTVVKVTGRTGERKGRLELTSGNVNYLRSGSDTPVLTLTYQQLLSLLEEHIEYRGIVPEKVRLPKPHPEGDFAFFVTEPDELGDPVLILDHHSSIKNLDERRLAHGRYQFSHDMAKKRRGKYYEWWTQVSVQAALWIVQRYVEVLENVVRKSKKYTDDSVTVSRLELRKILMSFVKRLDA